MKKKNKKNLKIIRQFSGTANYWADSLQIWYVVTYMDSIKYLNLIVISSVVIEIRGIENSELVVL